MVTLIFTFFLVCLVKVQLVSNNVGAVEEINEYGALQFYIHWLNVGKQIPIGEDWRHARRRYSRHRCHCYRDIVQNSNCVKLCDKLN